MRRGIKLVQLETGSDPRVAGLVYIAAFAPDKGESVNTLIANPPPGAPDRRGADRQSPPCGCRVVAGSVSDWSTRDLA